MSSKKKGFYHHLKQIQNQHNYLGLRGPSYDWKKEWGPIVKHDADWDWTYLLDLIIYKLEKMSLSLSTYSFIEENSLNKLIGSIEDIINLGRKIQLYDYEEEADKFFDDHYKQYMNTYDNNHTLLNSEPIDNYFGWVEEHKIRPADVSFSLTANWDIENGQEKWHNMLKDADKQQQQDINEFFKLIATNLRSWWY